MSEYKCSCGHAIKSHGAVGCQCGCQFTKSDLLFSSMKQRAESAEARASQLQAERAELARKLEQAQGLLSGALDAILQYHISKVWNEHYSFDSDAAKQYVNDNPTNIETALREAQA